MLYVIQPPAVIHPSLPLHKSLRYSGYVPVLCCRALYCMCSVGGRCECWPRLARQWAAAHRAAHWSCSPHNIAHQVRNHAPVVFTWRSHIFVSQIFCLLRSNSISHSVFFLFSFFLVRPWSAVCRIVEAVGGQ